MVCSNGGSNARPKAYARDLVSLQSDCREAQRGVMRLTIPPVSSANYEYILCAPTCIEGYDVVPGDKRPQVRRRAFF